MNRRVMFGALMAFPACLLAAQSLHAESYDDITKDFLNPAISEAATQALKAQYPSSGGGTNMVLIMPAGREEISVGSTITVDEKRINFVGGKLSLDRNTKWYDQKSLMLINSDIVMNGGEIAFTTTLESVKGVTAFDTATNAPVDTVGEYIKHALEASTFWSYYDKYTETCHVSLRSAGIIMRVCQDKGAHVNDKRHSSSDASLSGGSGEPWCYAEDFKAFIPATICPLKLSDAVDYRIGDAPWHSQTISAALTPEQKQAANALFAQGFDLYKGGDFVGAQTLINKGLESDPANFLAWFTLGEINRAAWKTKGDQDAAKTGYYDYMRVIDLAPKDSAQALLAANYLKDGGMN